MKTCKKLLSLLLSVLLVMSTFTVVLADEVGDASLAQITPVDVITVISENNIAKDANVVALSGSTFSAASVGSPLIGLQFINDGHVGAASPEHAAACVNDHIKSNGFQCMYQHRSTIKPVTGSATPDTIQFKFEWLNDYSITAINIYERQGYADSLKITANGSAVYTNDNMTGRTKITHTPVATIHDQKWEEENGSSIPANKKVTVGSAYLVNDVSFLPITFEQPVITDTLVFEVTDTADAHQVEFYEIEIIGTQVGASATNIAPLSRTVSALSLYNTPLDNVYMGLYNIKDGKIVDDGSKARAVFVMKDIYTEVINGKTYYKNYVTFSWDRYYDIDFVKVYAMEGNSGLFPSFFNVKDASGTLLATFNGVKNDGNKLAAPSASGSAYNSYEHMAYVGAKSLNSIVVEFYTESIKDPYQVWLNEIELYGSVSDTQVSDPEMSITNNIALTSVADVLGATSTTAQMLESNINDGLTISPAADADDKSYYKGERTVAYVNAFADATIDGVSYKEGYVHYYFNGLADIAGFKFYDVGNPAIKKVIAKDYDGNVLASYDVDPTKYPISDGYFTSRAHTAVAFDEIKELAGIYIYYYIDAASTATEIWLAEVEVFGQSKNDPAYINVASTPNGGSVHASNFSRGHVADLSICSCYKYTAADGKETGILGDTRYINDGSLGAKTDPNSTCTSVAHRFFTQQNLPVGENLILNFGFEQKSKVDTIIVYAKSCIDHGHINTLKVYNGDTLLTTYTPEYGNSCSAVRYIITLPAPVVTDSLKLEMVPQRDNFTYNGSEREMINKKIEFFEVEIYGIKSTFDISNGVITAKDISNTQGACLLVATYTDETKKELKSVQFVPLTNGEATYNVSALTNYKVFFTDGLNGLISYKVIEG